MNRPSPVAVIRRSGIRVASDRGISDATVRFGVGYSLFHLAAATVSIVGSARRARRSRFAALAVVLGVAEWVRAARVAATFASAWHIRSAA